MHTKNSNFYHNKKRNSSEIKKKTYKSEKFSKKKLQKNQKMNDELTYKYFSRLCKSKLNDNIKTIEIQNINKQY